LVKLIWVKIHLQITGVNCLSRNIFQIIGKTSISQNYYEKRILDTRLRGYDVCDILLNFETNPK